MYIPERYDYGYEIPRSLSVCIEVSPRMVERWSREDKVQGPYCTRDVESDLV